MRTTIWIALAYTACVTAPGDTACSTRTGWTDADGDGYGDPAAEVTACELPGDVVINNTDCDDSDNAVFPGAQETCNNTDDNCDGDTDIGATDALIWYPDDDSDNYGAKLGSVTACEAPDGYVASKTDCDDTDAAVHPGAAETWYDDVDQNCDGWSDYDADRDEYDAVPWGTDCDDDDADVNPGAPEIWYDGFDQNCDGGDDYDADADGWLYDSDCDDFHAEAHPGLSEVCGDGLDNDCDGTPNDCRRTGTTTGSAADAYFEGGAKYANLSVPAAAGDQTGDGIDDFFLIAPNAAIMAGNYYGVAYLFKGGSRYAGGDVATSASIWLEGASTFGIDLLVSNGDVDGDGHRDLVVSEYEDLGRVYVVRGPVTKTRSVAGTTITGITTDDHVGQVIAFVPDWDADGRDEVLVGAPGDDTNQMDGGAAWVFEGPISGTLDRDDADFTVLGEGWLGYSGAAGDFDGDGLGDVAVGERYYSPSPELNQAGRVVVFAGPLGGTVTADDAPTSWSGVYAQYVSRAVANVGDVDADGVQDVAFSSYIGTTIDADGRVYLMPGGTLASDLSGAMAVIDGQDGSGEDAGEYLGTVDFDGDGFSDLLVGAPSHDTSSGDEGAAYLFYGPISGTLDVGAAQVVVYGEGATGRSGIVAGIGDVDGDGYEDFGVGGPVEKPSGLASQGAVWLLYGTGM